MTPPAAKTVASVSVAARMVGSRPGIEIASSVCGSWIAGPPSAARSSIGSPAAAGGGPSQAIPSPALRPARQAGPPGVTLSINQWPGSLGTTVAPYSNGCIETVAATTIAASQRARPQPRWATRRGQIRASPPRRRFSAASHSPRLWRRVRLGGRASGLPRASARSQHTPDRLCPRRYGQDPGMPGQPSHGDRIARRRSSPSVRARRRLSP